MPRLTITVPDQAPQPYRLPIERDLVSFGRSDENDIQIHCSSVSMRHAEMCRVPGGFELRDLGSTNGTKLGETRQSVIFLTNSSRVKIGDVAFDFHLDENELAQLDQELDVKTESQEVKLSEVDTTGGVIDEVAGTGIGSQWKAQCIEQVSGLLEGLAKQVKRLNKNASLFLFVGLLILSFGLGVALRH
jgi:pSer/pThr/pTyr-binding forkhead associated (FHA) protein